MFSGCSASFERPFSVPSSHGVRHVPDVRMRPLHLRVAGNDFDWPLIRALLRSGHPFDIPKGFQSQLCLIGPSRFVRAFEPLDDSPNFRHRAGVPHNQSLNRDRIMEDGVKTSFRVKKATPGSSWRLEDDLCSTSRIEPIPHGFNRFDGNTFLGHYPAGGLGPVLPYN